MGEERTEVRERWVILVWNPTVIHWYVAAQFNADYEDTAKRKTKQLKDTFGQKNVRLLHTSDSQV